MTHANSTSAPRRPLQRFVHDQDGVSAVEFAMLLPLIVIMYLGSVEVTQAVSADRRTMMAAHTVGDLVSREGCVSTSNDLPSIFKIADEVVYPFPPTKLKIVVTGVKIDTTGKATVDWSQTNTNGTSLKRTTGATITSLIPTALRPTGADSYLIWAETQYDYTPAIGYVLTGTLSLKEKVYMRPRKSLIVTSQTAACPS